MNNLLCSRCKKRMAVIFMSRIENGETINEGLCLQCAKELGIPQVKDLIDKMGITDDDIESMNDQMLEMMQNGDFGGMNPEGGEEEDGFEMGGAQPFPFMQGFFGGSDLPEKVPQKEKSAKEPTGRPKKEKKYKYLDNYCENLTRRAREGGIDNIVGREQEIYRVMQILNRRTKNNPCLIGEPGVGKTAVAEGIAKRLASGEVPPRLADKELYMLDLTALVAGTQFRGQFESRVKGLVEDLKNAGNVILFIDEVHNLVGAGDAEGSMNAANILKPALSRGEIQVIGATTFNEYRKHIEKDAALERRFQPVTVNEPSIEDTVQVLMGIKEHYEQFHRVKVAEEICRRAAVLSERYITDRFLPDKAIDLLDEACSCSVLANQSLAQYDESNRRLKELIAKISDMEQSTEPDYEKLAQMRAEQLRLEGKIKEMEPQALNHEVTLEDLAKVIELWTGIPASRVRESELGKVAHLDEALKKHIVGQDEAVELVAAAIRRSRMQISPRRRPASFLFVGPTGVGKTELVKVLSQELFDDADPLIRLDMSEFMEKHAVSRLVGSPPGYVGYDEAGQLTEKVRRKPYSVVLFDEIEKAHPDVLNILLQILDEGRVTDAHGRVVSFENTVVVMTSNAGSEVKEGVVGFNTVPGQVAKDKAMKALSGFLRPEFMARIDEIVVFRPLDEKDFEKIAALMLDELKAPLDEKGIKFDYAPEALTLIAKEAYGRRSGARDIRRIIRKQVEDPICLRLLEDLDHQPALIKAVDQEGKIGLLTA
ncbi:ATP-dependent Clp protease ATP-binding subunit [Merdimmobilis hominis]|uniref:ATP-dependent Clp protease ATP-binding subunit n=1 Tax=Merdimmobilis hominis TaxID=2897707 RepID=UPI0008F8D186|nr:ATP-dependent Clp protease ATP-binding subunit [Merdimmobilis hominis]